MRKNKELVVPKKERKKKYYFRKFVLDIKRVRWPSNKTNWSSLTKIIIFTLIVVGFVFAITTLFAYIWAKLKIGL
ncbi:preprotein translocase subunit SecE [Mycoplasma crocodyli]|uniref:Probable preprotein translocase, SecE subunit n=1 Tax=Mycoplasma crocodyli (strain ATCC 51981 / MP145) TaxID=512564 RepID=D5E4U1_MYCCM|nr:preprotein translocase subunit SecE [Mycoplasma crocodyli]ADE19543.1 probable preprotein translocase, SecE subunit [Mycoplasma crocodyli MP145]